MSAAGGGWRPKVVVCGTGFGRVYLAATRLPGAPFELAGIVARGGARSRDCARHYGVPLYADVDQLPPEVDIACVVVGAAINGGPGAELAQRLMARGVHVLQEHPLHQAELAECLRQARRNGVVYHLNTHYVHLDPVAGFVAAARRLLERQRPLFVDALSCFQVLYPLLDILGSALGGVRPWSITAVPPAGAAEVLRTVNGVLAGVPVTLRVQNQLDPVERDNGGHILHRVTLATDGGNLLLANSHGPLLWTPRLHMPAEYADVVSVDECAAPELDLPAARCLTEPDAPSYRAVIRTHWPLAAARALTQLRQAILAGDDPLPRGQYHLALCRVVAEISAGLGRPQLERTPQPDILQAAELVGGQPLSSQGSASAR